MAKLLPNSDYSSMSINTKSKVKVYGKRWLVLWTFSINSLANALLFTSITSINNIVSKYYNVAPEVIDWAANSFDAVFILVAIPSSQFVSYFGMRQLVLIGSSLNAIGTCFHFAGVARNGIYYIMVGQFIAGFSVGAILQVPARLSAVWFPEHEHTRATSIAMAANVLGLGIGYIQPSYMVPYSSNPDDVYNGLYNMFLSHMVFLGICLISAYLFFDEKPALPPSYAEAALLETDNEDVPKFVQSIKMMASDLNFVMFALAYGFYFGIYNFFLTVLNEMTSEIITTKEVGWVGFSGNITTIISILIFSAIVDKFKCFKLVSIFLCIGSLFSWAFFTFVLLYLKANYWIFLSYNILCFFGVPFFVIGIEYAVELTFPIPEHLSSAVILILGNLFGLLFVVILGDLTDKGHLALVCYVLLGFYVATAIAVVIVKQKLRRHNMEVVANPNLMFTTGNSTDDPTG